MKKAVAAFAVLGMISGTAQAADEPLVFKPATAWAADYGEDYCRLARDFSNGEETIALAIERVQPTTLVKVMLVGDSIKLFRGATSIGYNYLPSGDGRQTFLLRSEANDKRQLLILDNANIGPDLAALFGGPGAGGPGGGGGAAAPAGPAFEPGTPLYNTGVESEYAAGITGLMLTDGTITPVRIETGSLKNVIGALQTCTYDLLTYWGVDGEKHRTISRTVVPQSGTTLPTGTIGFQDFGKLGGGANQIRVMVDASGAPTGCHVHFASLDESTNSKICNHLMKNAKFQPALDSAGQPMASYWISSPFGMFGPGPGG
jgi:hypothetical protein